MREPSVPPQSSVTERVAAHLAEANRLRAECNFVGALDEIAEAFVLDPQNETILTLDNEVQREYQLHKEPRKPEAPANPGVQWNLAANAGEKLVPKPTALPQVVGSLRRETIAPVDNEQELLQRARRLVNASAYEEALAELAVGLLMNARSAPLRSLEREIWNTLSQPDDSRSEPTTAGDKALLRVHLLAAKNLLSSHEFDSALDEVTKAYLIDPSSRQIRTMETRIRNRQQEFFTHNGVVLLPSAAKNGSSTSGARRMIELPVVRLANEVLVDASHDAYARALTLITEVRLCYPHNTFVIAAECQLRRLSDLSARSLLTDRLKEDMVDLLQALLVKFVRMAEKSERSRSLFGIYMKQKKKCLDVATEKNSMLRRLALRYLRIAGEYEAHGDLVHAINETRRVFLIEEDNRLAHENEDRLLRIKEISFSTSEADAVQYEEPASTPSRAVEAAVKDSSCASNSSPRSKHMRNLATAIGILTLVGLSVLCVLLWLQTRVTEDLPKGRGKDTEVALTQPPTSQKDRTLTIKAETLRSRKRTDRPGPGTNLRERRPPGILTQTQISGQEHPDISTPPSTHASHLSDATKNSVLQVTDTTRVTPSPIKSEAPELAMRQKLAKRHDSRATNEVPVTILREAELTRLASIEFPENAMRLHLEGRVVVGVMINAEGKPLKAEIRSSTNDVFDDAAMRTSMNSSFSPRITSHGAVSSWVTLPFNFRRRE